VAPGADAAQPPDCHTGEVNRAATWRDQLAGVGRRIAAPAHLPAIVGTVLAAAAVAELVIGLTLDRGSVAPLIVPLSVARTGIATVGLIVIVLVLSCLASTLPMAFFGPVATAVIVSVANVLSLTVFGTMTAAAVVAQLIAGYRLGRSGSEALAMTVGGPFLVIALAGPDGPGVRVRAVLLTALTPVAALAGSVRERRRQARENSTTRQAIAGTLLEHTAQRERARIARELHDVVAHHISMIAVQAETARLATPGMPPEGAKRLLGIGDTARAALTEMRRLLGVLREENQAGPDRGPVPADRHPQPGLRELNELIDEVRDASGSAARLIVRGAPSTLDPGVELTAYRIIQESLTNVRRHAPGAAIDVELHYTPSALRLRVRDNGPGPSESASSAGYGLLGMRERAAAVGGEVQAGPGPGVGFVVEACLPTTSKGTS
jgi:signal transduction histidine kinase